MARGENKAYLPVLMIDHNVMRLHISVHDALAVTVVERLQQLGDVVPYVQVVELGVEASEVGVVDIFEYERRSLTLLVTLEASERGQVEEGRGAGDVPENP